MWRCKEPFFYQSEVKIFQSPCLFATAVFFSLFCFCFCLFNLSEVVSFGTILKRTFFASVSRNKGSFLCEKFVPLTLFQWPFWRVVTYSNDFYLSSEIFRDQELLKCFLSSFLCRHGYIIYILTLLEPFIRGKIRRVLNKTRTGPFIRASMPCLILLYS